MATVAFGAIIASWFLADALAWRRLERAQAAFAENGFPTSIEQMLPPAPAREADNAATLIERVGVLMSSSHSLPNGITSVLSEIEGISGRILDAEAAGRPVDPCALADLTNLLGLPEIEEACRLLREASTRPVLRIEATYRLADDGPPHGLWIFNGARLLSFRASQAARMNRPAIEAWSEVEAALRLADLCAQRPTPLHMTVAIACTGMATDAARKVRGGYPDVETPADAMQALQRAVREHRDWLSRAIDGERLMSSAWIEATGAGWETLIRGTIPESSNPLRRAAFDLLRPCGRIELARFHEFLLEAALLAKRPPHEVTACWDDLIKRMADEDARFLSMILPTYKWLPATHADHLADLQATVIALSAADWRTQAGAVAVSVDTLGLPPDILTDPLTGRQLELECSGTAITARARVEQGTAPGDSPGNDPAFTQPFHKTGATIRLASP